VPLIGDGERPPSLSTATAMLNRIRAFKKGEAFNGWIDKRPDDIDGRWASRQNRHAAVSNSVNQPWILVNAWGVFDTGPSLRGLGLHAGGDHDYADDRGRFLTEDVEGLEEAGIDVVFCAGNCGEPCPDSRCGPGECGPGRSILGLNGHPGVLTVGAVRVDGLPAGYSAEGPGRLLNGWCSDEAALKERAEHKPDLCAPSNFHERGDASWLNLGTSAAAGIAAGVLARLRSVPGARALKPAEMRQVLRESAVEMPGQRSPWDPRLGHGVIHLERAMAELAKHPNFALPVA
jgi:hypothetical protein